MSNIGIREVWRRVERDEHVSVMPPWTIWVGAFVVLLVGAGSGWLLLSTFGGGSSQDKVRLEILKLTGSIVLGTGGGVALLLAARRQRATEVDLAQKRHDADERRVTELYTSAAEQLGSDKAAVRLAGLYALERLAQENTKHRPKIVDVICAYLRMPYTPPPADENLARSKGGVRHRGLRPPNGSAMSASPMRTISAVASTFSGIKEAREEQRQELQVRLAAQRLLTAHLRPEQYKQGYPRNEEFWPNMELDLTGAVLMDWDMMRCQVRSAVFEKAEFHGVAAFDEATFHKGASFKDAKFHNLAAFVDARLYVLVKFAGTRFESTARFTSATFTHIAAFNEATFHEACWFDDATFNSITSFEDATFDGTAQFKKAMFGVFAAFGGATFHGEVDFSDARAIANSAAWWPSGWVWREDAGHTESADRWGTLVSEEGAGEQKTRD